MFSRREFLGTLIGSAGLCSSTSARELLATSLPQSIVSTSRSQQSSRSGIDRVSLISRHNPVLRAIDPLTPLSLGNGAFAFTGDVTGLQTLQREYDNAMPLCTLSQWGWHTQPAPEVIESKILGLTEYDTHGREVGYHTGSKGQTVLYNWLRENPHRLHLGRIGLQRTGGEKEIRAADISQVEQTLDLWSGILTSKFKLDGKSVAITTAVHPRLDLLAVVIESSLLGEGQLTVRVAFPYGSSSMQAADWKQPDRHQTRVLRNGPAGAELHRILDEDEYFVALHWQTWAKLATEDKHTFILEPQQSSNSSERNARVELVVAFSLHRLTEGLASAAHSMCGKSSTPGNGADG